MKCTLRGKVRQLLIEKYGLDVGQSIPYYDKRYLEIIPSGISFFKEHPECRYEY